MTFTAENTEGYSATELKNLNDALAMLLAEMDDDEDNEDNLSDILHNEHFPCATVADLYTAVRDRLGLNA